MFLHACVSTQLKLHDTAYATHSLVLSDLRYARQGALWLCELEMKNEVLPETDGHNVTYLLNSELLVRVFCGHSFVSTSVLHACVSTQLKLHDTACTAHSLVLSDLRYAL